jgi:hypothetical protein
MHSHGRIMLLTHFLIHQQDKHTTADIFMMLKAWEIILLLNNYALLKRLLFLKEAFHFSSAKCTKQDFKCMFVLSYHKYL